MTKQEAIQSMEEGYKVTHEYFTDEEWMKLRNGVYIFEDGVKCTPNEFWKHRQAEWYNEGWSIYEE